VAKIEFYLGSSDRHIAVLDDGAMPRPGETVNIRHQDYTVTRVAWAVDNAGDVFGAKLRAAVELEPKALHS